MYVYGSSKSVRALESLLKSTMTAIDSKVSELDTSMSQIRASYRDDGIDEIAEAVKKIKIAVDDAKGGAANVEKALDAHAAALESIGK